MVERPEGVSSAQWIALAGECQAHGLHGLFGADHYTSTRGHPARESLERRRQRVADGVEAAREIGGTSHQFRHMLATRLVNNEVSLETVRRLLDHGSPGG